MSRVIKPGNKYMNTAKYDGSITGPSKKVRIHCEGEDYHKADTLAQWLFVKYDMSYQTYRNKSKKRREELRNEFEADTGVDLQERERIRMEKNPWSEEVQGTKHDRQSYWENCPEVVLRIFGILPKQGEGTDPQARDGKEPDNPTANEVSERTDQT